MTDPEPENGPQPSEHTDLDRLLAAVIAVAAGGSAPDVLRHIVGAACELVDARYGALGVIGYDQRLSQFVSHGLTDAQIAAIGPLPEGKGLLGRLIVDPRPLRLRDLRDHPDAFGFPPNHPRMQSFLGVPIHLGRDVFGNLYLCEKEGADEFSQRDETLAVSFAAVAAVAIENLRLHERLQDLAVLQDRERIARQLHDNVIQRLFAAGMSLQAQAPLAEEPVASRIQEAVDELDATIADIRATIFDLEARSADRPTLTAAVLDLVEHMTHASRLEPTVRLVGPLNSTIEPELGDEVLTVVRESLSNVLRHAKATGVEITVSAGSDLEVTVRDDGQGPPGGAANPTGHGLRNLATRARARGGSLRFEPEACGGTLLEWRIPLGS